MTLYIVLLIISFVMLIGLIYGIYSIVQKHKLRSSYPGKFWLFSYYLIFFNFVFLIFLFSFIFFFFFTEIIWN